MSDPNRGARPLPGPVRLQQMYFSFGPARVLSVAVQLDFFSHIAAGNKTAAAIAAAAKTSERGTRMLLDALVALELLMKSNDSYALSPDAARYLVRTSPDYMGAFLESEEMWNMWSRLADAVRTGQPIRSANERTVAEEFFPILVRTLHITNGEPARRLAGQLTSGDGKRGLRVLDIGCGSAVWSIAVAKADDGARVTAFDFPKVLDTTRQFAAREGVEDRFEYLPGDLRSAEFPTGAFDLAILGNIVHAENEANSRDLFGRIYRALDSGGRLAIIDMVPNDERSGPPLPVLFALNMLVNTDEGDTYTMAQYRDWLTAAGFARVDTVDIESHSPVIVATKSGS